MFKKKVSACRLTINQRTTRASVRTKRIQRACFVAFLYFLLLLVSILSLPLATIHDFQPGVPQEFFKHPRATRPFSQEHRPAPLPEQDVSRTTGNVPTFLVVVYPSSCLSFRPGVSFSTCFARTRFGWLLQRKPRKIFTSTMYRRFAIDVSREFLTRNNKNLQCTRRYVTLR